MLIVKGILIGMFVCIPVGPIGLISIQRSIYEGQLIGMLSGIGAAVSDSIYCALAVFGMNYMNGLIEEYKYIINELVGILFIFIGISIIIKSRKRDTKINNYIHSNNEKISKFTSTFLMGLSNPMTLLVFITVFASVNINSDPTHIIKNSAFIISVFGGSCLLWFLVTSVIKIYNHKIEARTFKAIDKVIGMAICLFGVFNILKG